MPSQFVTLRGIRYRRARSLIVVLLATLATAAAVVIPAYTRAAQQSVLTDTVTAVWPATAGISANGRAGAVGGAADLAAATASVDAGLAGSTVVDLLDPPIGAAWHDKATITPANYRTITNLVFRTGVCDHLVMTAGTCAQGEGEGVVSARSAADSGWQVGQRIEIVPPGPPGFVIEGPQPPIVLTVTGLYRARDEQSTYWGNALYFNGGTSTDDVAIADAVFAGAETDLLAAVPGPLLGVEYHFSGDLRLDQVPAVRADLAELGGAVTTSTVSSGLPASLDEAARQQSTLAGSVPLIAVPLVLLCWFVLFLVVAALTEERGPEIALSKLRGMRLGQVVTFAAAEPMLLIAFATPLGLGLGLALTQAGARTFLAAGTHVELRWPVLLVAAVAFAGAAVAAVLATRNTVRASVLSLLRRVPPRAPWRAVAVESAVGALALVGLFQVLAGGDRSSPVAYLAPPLLALVAGLLAARLLSGWARIRGRTAVQRGNVPVLLASAQIARRPATARVVVLLTVATALLTFAVTIWDVAAINRQIAARASVGAPVVHTVAATDPGALLAAVRIADPDGRQAMAVAWSSQRYSGVDLRMAAVDAGRLGTVVGWPDRTPAEVAAVGELLAPPPPNPPVRVRGPVIEADVDVASLAQAEPARLVLVVAHNSMPRQIDLGPLRPGRHTYRGTPDGCPDGCRLLGLGVRRYPADFSELNVDLTITAVRDGSGPLDLRLGADGGWRAPAEQSGPTRLSVQPAGAGLRLTGSSSSADMVAEYADDATAAPLALAGPAPAADPTASEFDFLTIGAKLTHLRVVDRSLALPGVGRPALMVDLETVLRQAERDGLGNLVGWRYEVWTTADAGPDLVAALGDAGLQVTGSQTTGERLTELGRLAPALALRLYLLAGVVAALLGVGVLLLNARVGARARLRETAALRLVGVSGRMLRQALRREYATVIAVPLVIGLGAGLGGAVLLLPAIPLVTIGAAAIDPVYRAGPLWLPAAVGALVAVLLLAAASVLRTVGRADPGLLREEVR
ncbi:FtsX-like permease family protein [Polymorphospora rubra]|uniref:FtsX-like permease family protein n=1 Tax=Polymorphospora rubra TaxID=338584 RepID=UPI0033E91B2C